MCDRGDSDDADRTIYSNVMATPVALIRIIAAFVRYCLKNGNEMITPENMKLTQYQKIQLRDGALFKVVDDSVQCMTMFKRQYDIMTNKQIQQFTPELNK